MAQTKHKTILLAAIDTAYFWSVLLVCLSAMMLAVMLVFSFFIAERPANHELLARMSWCFSALGFLFGLLYPGALIAMLNMGSIDKINLYLPMARCLAAGQLISLLAAVVLGLLVILFN